MNATIKLEKKHFPVLLEEVESIISPLYGGTFIDCTFGQGGYSERILNNKFNYIVATDRDADTSKYVKKIKTKYGKRFTFINSKFSDIHNLGIEIKNLKGVVFDLGYSINQIKDLSRGISFNSSGKLDMRMGINKISADEVINKMEYQSLNKIFKYLGDEKFSKSISKLIIKKRKIHKLETQDLVKIIDRVKKKTKKKINNSTKVFQSLRIFVNDEISELIYGLINSFKILPVGGVIVVISFHSLEDKIVKYFFKHYSEQQNLSRYLPENIKKKNLFKLINKNPITPSLSEIKKNPPSRSAKLRFAFKTNHSDNFKDFINKFQFYLNIEKLKGQI